MKKIWKRTIYIYTDYNPEDIDIEDLSRDAMAGLGHYVYLDEEVLNPSEDPDLIDSDFFHRCLENGFEDTDD